MHFHTACYAYTQNDRRLRTLFILNHPAGGRIKLKLTILRTIYRVSIYLGCIYFLQCKCCCRGPRLAWKRQHNRLHIVCSVELRKLCSTQKMVGTYVRAWSNLARGIVSPFRMRLSVSETTAREQQETQWPSFLTQNAPAVNHCGRSSAPTSTVTQNPRTNWGWETRCRMERVAGRIRDRRGPQG